MTFWAWVVFVAALGYTILDGVRRTRGVRDLEGFFAAGRSIPWWAAGLSVMATQLSAITIIGGVGMGYEHGLEWVQFYFALPFAMVILCIWFVPMYRRSPILTAYEFLERRFGPITRSLTSATFLLSRCLAFAVVLYAPAVVFSVMTGLPIGPTVWITGLLTTAYTAIGGFGGVVWTDVKQMFVILLSVVICVITLLWSNIAELSFGGLMTALGAAGHLNAVEVRDPAWTFAPVLAGVASEHSFWADKYNLWTGLFGTLVLFLSYFGCDQSQVQSILTSKSIGASRRALLLSAFTKVPLQLLVLFLGGLIFVHQALGKEPVLFNPEIAAKMAADAPSPEFEQARARHTAAAGERRAAMLRLAHGEGDRGTAIAEFRRAAAAADDARAAAHAAAWQGDVEAARAAGRTLDIGDSNYIFPQYMFAELPKPLLGLVLAAIFAAAISSAAGALSSLTSATMIDFARRLRPQAEERDELRTSRLVMLGWGTAATAAATWLGGGPLLERVNEVGSWFYGSILGVFVLALAVPRADGRAASAGLLGGLALVFVVHNQVQVAYLWYNLVGALGCLLVGGAVALLAPAVNKAT